jgi:hypothetical protein
MIRSRYRGVALVDTRATTGLRDEDATDGVLLGTSPTVGASRCGSVGQERGGSAFPGRRLEQER